MFDPLAPLTNALMGAALSGGDAISLARQMVGKRQMRLLKVDETEHWHGPIAKQCKRIFGVYLYNPDRTVNCCEITPSFECYFVESQYEYADDDCSEEEREQINEEIMEGDRNTEPVSYWHTWQVKAAERLLAGQFPKKGMGTLLLMETEESIEDLSADEFLESCREDQCANPL